MRKEITNFQTFINHPAGFAILLNELYQFCALDFNRAKILGFSDKLINENKQYTQATGKFLMKQLKIKTNKNQTPQQLATTIANANFTLSPYLKTISNKKHK